MDKSVTHLSRRKALMVAGGGVAAVGALAASPFRTPLLSRARSLVARQPWLQRLLSLADGSYEEWLAQVGTTFAVGGGMSMRLVGVRAFASPGARPFSVSRRTGFVAAFDVPRGQSMAGDLIYTAHHPRYGPLQILLSASPDPRTPWRMQAVFN